VEVSLNNASKLERVCEFLTENNLKGDKKEYMIKYTSEYLLWEMNNNGYFLNIVDSDNKIIGTIGFTFKNIQLYANTYRIIEPIYMLCNKKYYKTGVAKVLMNETIRQSLLLGINEGVFSTTKLVAKPIVSFRQYLRPINYKKLRKHNFIERIMPITSHEGITKKELELEELKNQ
jgi:hypothetical protein